MKTLWWLLIIAICWLAVVTVSCALCRLNQLSRDEE